MKCVLDASVALKWVFQETDSVKARQVRDDYQQGTHELLAPDIFTIEVAHVLSKAHRTNQITAQRAEADLASIIADLPQLFPAVTLLPRAFEISLQVRMGVYDCFYIALSEVEQCALLTADQRMITNLQGQFPQIVSLSTL